MQRQIIIPIDEMVFELSSKQLKYNLERCLPFISDKTDQEIVSRASVEAMSGQLPVGDDAIAVMSIMDDLMKDNVVDDAGFVAYTIKTNLETQGRLSYNEFAEELAAKDDKILELSAKADEVAQKLSNEVVDTLRESAKVISDLETKEKESQIKITDSQAKISELDSQLKARDEEVKTTNEELDTIKNQLARDASKRQEDLLTEITDLYHKVGVIKAKETFEGYNERQLLELKEVLEQREATSKIPKRKSVKSAESLVDKKAREEEEARLILGIK